MEKEKKIHHHDRLSFVIRLIEDYLSQPGNSANQLALSIEGVSSGVISALRKRKYSGNLDAVLTKIEQFFEIHQARIKTLPNAELVETSQIKNITRRIMQCHIAKNICIVVGSAGIGKTEALKLYAKKYRGQVYYIQANPYMRCKSGFLRKLCTAFDIQGTNDQNTAFDRLANKASQIEALILIDDAQVLSSNTSENATIFEVIRALNDKGVGFVLCGNRRLRDRVTSRAEEFYQQFASRSTILEAEDRFSEKVIKEIIFGITGVNLAEDQFKYLHSIANNFYGSLRVMVRILMIGIWMAQSKQMKLQLKHLELAAKDIVSMKKPNVMEPDNSKKGFKNVARIKNASLQPMHSKKGAFSDNQEHVGTEQLEGSALAVNQ